MKKNGFTLIELLGVLVIIGIIAVLVFPAVESILKEGKETTYQVQVNTILNAAYDYSLKNIKFLPQPDDKNYITLGELKAEGLVDVNITNPDTKEKFLDNLVISIHNVGAGYTVSNSNSKVKGDYLYTLEFNQTEGDLPKIQLSGITSNSDGNYIVSLNLNDDFEEPRYYASSSAGDNLTSKVKKYILNGDVKVDEILTNESTIYKIYYVVADDQGNATVTILNVIVADAIAPTITFPSKSTISTQVSSFDLMSGVVCEDNSGYCDLTYTGQINFGVTGKYIIEYTAKDPSGNTFTKERVITIE